MVVVVKVPAAPTAVTFKAPSPSPGIVELVAVLVVEGDAGQEGARAGAREILGDEGGFAALIVADLEAEPDLAEIGVEDVRPMPRTVHQVRVQQADLVLEPGGRARRRPSDVLAGRPGSGQRIAGGRHALRRSGAARPGVRENIGADHPGAMALGGFVEIAVEGERLGANLGAFGIDQLEQILLQRSRL